jgi:hypothetical protein
MVLFGMNNFLSNHQIHKIKDFSYKGIPIVIFT